MNTTPSLSGAPTQRSTAIPVPAMAPPVGLAAEHPEPASALIGNVCGLAQSNPAAAQALAATTLARALLRAVGDGVPLGQRLDEGFGLSWAPGLDGADAPAVVVRPRSVGSRFSGRQRYALPPEAQWLVLVLPTSNGQNSVPLARLGIGDPRLDLTPDPATFAEHPVRRGWATVGGALANDEVLFVARSRVDALQLLDELLGAAVEQGIIAGFLAKAGEHLRTRSRPWPDTGIERASDDPHVLRRFGEYMANFNALSEILDEASVAVDGAIAGRGSPSEAVVHVAAARLFAARLGKELISGTIELLGASSASGRHGFDAYWRDFTDHIVNQPPRWGIEAVGAAHFVEAGKSGGGTGDAVADGTGSSR